MKTIVTLVIGAFTIVGMNSCDQCTECTKPGADAQELCKQDYASNDSYDAAYKLLVSQGYDCD